MSNGNMADVGVSSRGARRSRFVKVAGVALLVAAALLAAAIHWLFYDNRLPTDGAFAIDVPRLRATTPGTGPMRVEVEEVSHTFVPKIGVVAGTSWRRFDMMRTSYRLVWPNRSIVIDSGNSLALARKFGAASYDVGAWRRIQRAMLSASDIVVTHEHADHIGGIMESPALTTVLPRTRLTPEQVDIGNRADPLRWPAGALRGYHPLHYGDIHALAPGVILIRSPGHTPGSQMVYVRRADGRELLFMGDVASAADNVALERMRPRYTTQFYGTTHDDRLAVMLETVALHKLHEQHPEIALVPGHDAVAIRALERQGLLAIGFQR